MVAKNPITGDEIRTKVNTDAYRDNWDKIFRKECAHEYNWRQDGDIGSGWYCIHCGEKKLPERVE